MAVTQEQWNKTKTEIQRVRVEYKNYRLGTQDGVRHSVLNSVVSFLVYVAWAYLALKPYIKGGHPFANANTYASSVTGKTTRHSAVGSSQLHAKNKPKKTPP